MLKILQSIYGGLFPDGDQQNDPAAQLRWRKFVGNLLFIITANCLIVGLGLTVGLPRAGSVVWAADLDGEIEKSTKPLDERISKVEKIVAEQGNTTKALLAKIAGDQVGLLVKRRCKTNDPDDKDYLTREINRYAEEYEDNKGKPYRIPRCSELESRESK